MNDLFNNTVNADNRSETVKSFDDLQQEQDEQRKQNKMDTSGLPLFSENEREARNTKQESLF